MNNDFIIFLHKSNHKQQCSTKSTRCSQFSPWWHCLSVSKSYLRIHLLCSQPRVRKAIIATVDCLFLILYFVTTASNFTVIAPVEMRSAGSFGVLAGSTVTNSGFTTVMGDLGLYPGSSVVGAPGVIGTSYVGTSYALIAKQDLNTAHLDADSRPMTAAMAGDLGGLTLTPGVYKSATSIGITNILYLDAQFRSDAVWIFQVGTLLTVNAYSQVIMINAAPYPNNAPQVWWSCGSSATIATGAIHIGTIMASQSVSVAVGSSTGPLMASIGGVTLLSDSVHVYQPVVAVPSQAPVQGPGSSTQSAGASSSDGSQNASVSAGAVVGLVFMGFLAGLAAMAMCICANKRGDGEAAYHKTDSSKMEVEAHHNAV